VNKCPFEIRYDAVPGGVRNDQLATLKQHGGRRRRPSGLWSICVSGDRCGDAVGFSLSTRRQCDGCRQAERDRQRIGNSCQRKHPAEILALGPCASNRRSSNAIVSAAGIRLDHRKTRGAFFFAARLPVSRTAAEPVAKSRANLSTARAAAHRPPFKSLTFFAGLDEIEHLRRASLRPPRPPVARASPRRVAPVRARVADEHVVCIVRHVGPVPTNSVVARCRPRFRQIAL
jgi:hypothetical protein